MLEPVDVSVEGHRKRTMRSVIAICCPVLLVGMIFFLETPQGRAFNEQLFARYYTLGALLMLGFYGAIGFCLVVFGLTLGVIACVRRETPLWLPCLAVVANVLAPLAVLRYVG
jgi:hypothetical protein